MAERLVEIVHNGPELRVVLDDKHVAIDLLVGERLGEVVLANSLDRLGGRRGFAGVSDDEFVLSPHAARPIAMMPTMPSKQVFVNFLVILWLPLRRLIYARRNIPALYDGA